MHGAKPVRTRGGTSHSNQLSISAEELAVEVLMSVQRMGAPPEKHTPAREQAIVSGMRRWVRTPAPPQNKHHEPRKGAACKEWPSV